MNDQADHNEVEKPTYDQPDQATPIEDISERAQDHSEQLLHGVISRVVFQNQENGYSVFRVDSAEHDGEVTVVGHALNLSSGTHISARGIFQTHPRFGRQFSALSITEVTPSGGTEILSYLASGIIKGVGAKTAEKLVEAFGDATLDVLVSDPDRAAAIPGIGRHKAMIMHDALREKSDDQEILKFLLKHQITLSLAHRILRQYGRSTIEVVSRDPYRLAREVWGIGFKTADAIALAGGMSVDSSARIKAGLVFTLQKASETEGHCYLKKDDLLQRTSELLQLADSHDIATNYHELLYDGEYQVLEVDGFVGIKLLADNEEFVANCVRQRLEKRSSRVTSEEVTDSIEQTEKELGITLSVEQRETVRRAASEKLLIVTGGPGCGKTTVVRALANLFVQAGLILRLASPTGRAAQRLSEVCGLPASTIHRLLRFDPRKNRFTHDEKLPLMADVVIVDEASMLDIYLARSLFAALKPETTLILVGDKDQLPSVGPGKVLADLLSLPQIPSVGLSVLFRRGRESSINSLAHMINAGEVPHIPEPDGKTKTDAYFLPRATPDAAAKTIENLVADVIPTRFAIPASDITVLTPMNRGPLGTESLNRRMQQRLNPQVDTEQEIDLGTTVFRLNDRVCQRVNNYDLHEAGVYNGDTGRIFEVDKQRGRLSVELWDGRLIDYEKADLSELSLAYAVTVHRSQGSEIRCVVLALHDQHFTLLERQLIYTAVTRAKQLLIVVGSKRALQIACKKSRAGERLTLLAKRIVSPAASRAER